MIKVKVKSEKVIKTVLDFYKQSGNLEEAKKKTGALLKLQKVPRTYHILLYAQKHSPQLAKIITKKTKLHASRSLSGIVSVTVLTKNFPCPYKCAYCPKEKNIPQSYLSDEPAVARAQLVEFDPYRQVSGRLNVLKISGHEISKMELIVLGGTFSFLPHQYRLQFIKKCFDAANQSKSKNLQEAQKLNEKSQRRIVGITIETRPDLIDKNEIKFLRKLGVTRVELGAQNYFNFILRKNERKATRKQLENATKLLRDNGFKITYHLMLNLPGSNPFLDFWSSILFFINPNFRPDHLKIYPLVVVKGSKVYKWYKKGKFRPYSNEVLIKILAAIKSYIPNYVRIVRVIRDIPANHIKAGLKNSNLREKVQEFMHDHNMKCKCIRCREIKSKVIKNAILKIKRYRANGGSEYFLSIVDKNTDHIAALLRLRLTKNSQPFFKVLKNAALVREIHTYGEVVGLDNKTLQASQHRGFGSWLIGEAEKIAKKNGFDKIVVIAGVGVRGYFRKHGYKLGESYMVKKLEFKC
ncbi:MAG: tRNA uridine(34) 5-carboxymethylaminomethyl modification radical SAM/GNAT enzyme Elp3 [Patescibacteria group bacterium]|nr:tRNA uridine(34) 5-carboxymethylaminomethyl modification radical SAM/GNAT enzyme Elp3 [Patescibacteria group bacterium]